MPKTLLRYTQAEWRETVDRTPGTFVEQRAVIDPAAGEKALQELAGVSPEQLQAFLEEKAGISPDEEAQGSVMAAAATVAFH